MIDFYRLSADFPRYIEAKKQNDVEKRVLLLENACSKVINNSDLFLIFNFMNLRLSYLPQLKVLNNGFSTILDKCPRFKFWIKLLEDKISG